jgi:hypothetical protein
MNSPYAGSAYAGGLEGLQPAKYPSFLYQARATPAPDREKGFFGETTSPQTPLCVR